MEEKFRGYGMYIQNRGLLIKKYWMSLTAQQDDLLQLIKKRIKNLRNLVYGHGLNEQEVLTILRNIMIRCCPKNYTDCFSKDKSFINII